MNPSLHNPNPSSSQPPSAEASSSALVSEASLDGLSVNSNFWYSQSSYKKLKNGNYEVTINFDVTKYKADEEGKRTFKNEKGKMLKVTKKGKKYATESYPLNDYI